MTKVTAAPRVGQDEIAVLEEKLEHLQELQARTDDGDEWDTLEDNVQATRRLISLENARRMKQALIEQEAARQAKQEKLKAAERLIEKLSKELMALELEVFANVERLYNSFVTWQRVASEITDQRSLRRQLRQQLGIAGIGDQGPLPRPHLFDNSDNDALAHLVSKYLDHMRALDRNRNDPNFYPGRRVRPSDMRFHGGDIHWHVADRLPPAQPETAMSGRLARPEVRGPVSKV